MLAGNTRQKTKEKSVLDIKQIRENPQLIQERLNTRSGKYEIQPILELDQKQRELEATANIRIRPKTTGTGSNAQSTPSPEQRNR